MSASPEMLARYCLRFSRSPEDLVAGFFLLASAYVEDLPGAQAYDGHLYPAASELSGLHC
jgi:hypothetical protein